MYEARGIYYRRNNSHMLLRRENRESCAAASPDDSQGDRRGMAKDGMSNWPLRNDHEVSVVTLMTRLY